MSLEEFLAQLGLTLEGAKEKFGHVCGTKEPIIVSNYKVFTVPGELVKYFE